MQRIIDLVLHITTTTCVSINYSIFWKGCIFLSHIKVKSINSFFFFMIGLLFMFIDVRGRSTGIFNNFLMHYYQLIINKSLKNIVTSPHTKLFVVIFLFFSYFFI